MTKLVAATAVLAVAASACVFDPQLAAGWRGIRPGFGERDEDTWVAEPRVRGQLWLSPQVTFGATLGTSLAERAWMAGIAFGFHSHAFDVFGRRR